MPEREPPDHRYPKSHRLRKSAEFLRVYRSNVFAADEVLVIQGIRNELGHPRLGLNVSRKVGNAVVRNRWKRLIRESFRLSKRQLPVGPDRGIDLVVRPRKGAEPGLSAIQRSLGMLAQRIDHKLSKSKKKNHGKGQGGAS